MKKKYILKPGRHQFVPGSPPVHTNDNLTDDEAEWYLNKYPHIASLFLKDHREDEIPKPGPREKATSINPTAINKTGQPIR